MLVGWWLPCCSPSLEVDSPTGGFPGQGLSSILAVLGGGVECPCNEAASPAKPEEMRGRGVSAWLTPFPLPLVIDGPDHFLHSLSLQKLEAMANAQVKGPPFGWEQGILIGWRAPTFSPRMPEGGSSPAPVTVLLVSVSCSVQLLNLSALWAGLSSR